MPQEPQSTADGSKQREFEQKEAKETKRDQGLGLLDDPQSFDRFSLAREKFKGLNF